MTETLSPILSDSLEDAARRVLVLASEAELTIATAESCTGGLLASLLTDIEGVSHVFDRGMVTYSERAKCELLGLAQEKIDTCGAVSREVSVAMAEGALKASGADVVLAITGFAGRGGESEEPGLVHLACLRRDHPIEHREEHFGDIGRGPVRLACLEIAASMLERAVSRG